MGNRRVWLVSVGKDERNMSINGNTCKATTTLKPKRTVKRVVLAGRFALGVKVADQDRKSVV